MMATWVGDNPERPSASRRKNWQRPQYENGFNECSVVSTTGTVCPHRRVEQALRLKPDVVVLNITMPILSGLEAAREIRAKLPKSAIVILSSHADQQFIEEARRMGARAYVAKTKIGDALIRAIGDAVDSGDFVLVA